MTSQRAAGGIAGSLLQGPGPWDTGLKRHFFVRDAGATAMNGRSSLSGVWSGDFSEMSVATREKRGSLVPSEEGPDLIRLLGT